AADLEKVEPNNAEVLLTDQGVSEGQQALLVRFAQVDWPNVYFREGKGFEDGDWRRFGGLAVDITNPEQEPISVCIRVDDDFSADGSRHCRTGRASLPPGRATVVMPLGAAVPEGMRGGPPVVPPPALQMGTGGQTLDWSHIVAFQIFLPRPDTAHTLALDNLRLLPMPELEGMVDRYGQYSRGEWLGKVRSDEDLRRQRDEEEDWLREHQPAADRDRFGGWSKGPKLEASGFFRTAYVVEGQEVEPPAAGEEGEGRWWLVTPEGRLFFSLGVDCVRYGQGTRVQGREELFSWLPEAGDPLAEFSKPGQNRWANFYGMNLRRKYGQSWKAQWLEMTARRLPAWGFNTIGNWSEAEVFRLRRVPYTVPIHYGGDMARFETAWRSMPDVFDERFGQVVEKTIAERTKEWRDDPWCLGYFVDNELSWGGWGGSLRSRYDLPLRVLADEGRLPAKKEFVSLLRRKHGDIGRLNEAWKVEVASWEQLQSQAVELPAQLTEECAADLGELLAHFARRYFEAVRGAMKQHAPNQLYLGCRFAPRPMEVVKVAAEYCDVVSFNIYNRGPEEGQWAFTTSLGKPCIIGEFHFGALDRGMFHGGLVPVANQRERGEAYQAYVREVWQLPAFVGCHWFQYLDQALTGRGDGENYNIGFLSVADRPHWELAEAARELNRQVYQALGRRQD
ncbi:MAG: hypothetical protein ACE5R4_01230, partial [Armatimonadota bacterium]